MANPSTVVAYRSDAAHRPFSLASESEPGDGSRKPVPHGADAAEREDLPYKVELWDKSKNTVEQILAVTANASIGYAAYYAATREHPDRYITLRHKNGIVSRWNGPTH
ncbi:hypothetical protein [Chelativorans sp.]|uniref:hypothetical protein n=1 Tax=Chelativorans sp. TaxID=2203393 RepID=UPI0028118447|nr:hypothetical protein [Chelativorans sp.]